MSTADLGLRERKKRQTRAALQEAAMALFAAKGYERTTIEEIAEAAEVSPRTFFRYFATKEDVLEAEFTETMQVVRDSLASRPAGQSMLDALYDLSLAVCAQYESRREFYFARWRLFQETPALGSRALRWMHDFDTVVSEIVLAELRLPPKQQTPAMLAVGALNGVFAMSVQLWYDAGGRRRILDIWRQGFEMMRPALEPLFG